MRLLKGNNAEIVNYLFQSLLVTYLVLLLVEQLWEGVVSVYLNLNYLLIAVIVVGVIDVFSDKPHKAPNFYHSRKKDLDYWFIFVLGILGFFIIKFKTADLGWLSWIISLIAGALIFLLSALILEEKDETY